MNFTSKTPRTFVTLAAFGVLTVAATGCGRAKYLCASKQAEAKASLTMLASLEASSLADNKTYSSSLTDLKYDNGMTRFYAVSIDSASATTYRATATGKDDMSGDVWKVDQTGAVTAVTDKCSSL